MASSQFSSINSGKLGLGVPPLFLPLPFVLPPPPPTIRPDQGRCYSFIKCVLHCESSFVTFISTEGSAGWKQRTYSLFQPTLSPHTSSLLVLLPYPPTSTPTPYPSIPTPSSPPTINYLSYTWNHGSQHGTSTYHLPGTSLKTGPYPSFLSFLQ